MQYTGTSIWSHLPKTCLLQNASFQKLHYSKIVGPTVGIYNLRAMFTMFVALPVFIPFSVSLSQSSAIHGTICTCVYFIYMYFVCPVFRAGKAGAVEAKGPELCCPHEG